MHSHRLLTSSKIEKFTFVENIIQLSIKQYPVNAGVPQSSILGSTLFLLYINDLLDDVICNIPIYADDTTFYCKCDQASDLW